ncbi:MAG: hemerythrin domain-containing protein [Myxococcales bacterium]|nr:hemerythrin domain-containing protein [Myxococcales bacterium]
MSAQPTEILRREHATILDALDRLEALAGHLDAGVEIPSEEASELVRFLVDYVDRFHHEKEEQFLFPALLRAGMPATSGPVPVMLHEHDLGRRFVRTMAAIAQQGLIDRESFVAAASGFVELMRIHIRKENNALFVMAEQVLSDAAKQALLDEFKARGDYLERG